MIRIISGKHKGRRIQAPKNLPVRPTTDRAKESLFNILNNRFYFEDLQCLDLFSGTGNISFELASRGSESIIAVDSSTACIRFIDKISDELEMPIITARSEVMQYLEREYRKFDLIFADPPYDFEQYEKLVDRIYLGKLLAPDGLLILEHSSRSSFDHLDGFQEVRAYGNVAFSFFGPVDG